MNRDRELYQNSTGILCVLLNPILEQDRSCDKVLDEFRNNKWIKVINRDTRNPCLLNPTTQKWLTLAYVQ